MEFLLVHLSFTSLEAAVISLKQQLLRSAKEMEEIPLSTVVDGGIIGIRFSLATHQEICASSISDCPISHPSQLTNPFLGLPLESGHFGYIQLPIPIYHPCHVSELKRILSLLCLKCLRMIKKKIVLTGKKERSSNASCSHCQDVLQVSVREVKAKDGQYSLELKLPSRSRLRDGFWNFLERYGFRYGDSHSRTLLPCEALEILKRIPEETRKKLAAKGYFPQRGYILQHLPVPPNCLSVPDISDGTSIMSSDLSVSMLKKVLKQVEIIKSSRSGSPNFESQEVEANDLQSAIAQYLHIRGTAKASRDVNTRLGVSKETNESSTKAWLEKMRTLFIRKGSGFSSRSVITGDAYKGINEIGLPFEIAQRITFEERVNMHNLNYLQELVDNKLCLTYKDGMSTYSLKEGSKGHTSLRPGQVVHRRIMDGDIVFINRPPSTHKHSLQAFSVYVHYDHTVKINPLICGPLGADFDGDCVHLFYPQSLAAKAEVLELFSVEKQLLSSHSGNLNLQFANDSLLSLNTMFKIHFFDKAAAQQLAMFVSTVLPQPALWKTHSGPRWTALQILQTALPTHFDCCGERHLIGQSEMLKVDFNRDVVQSLFNEIITSIFFKKGSKEALKFFNSLQPMLMENIFSEGFSVGLKDFSIFTEVIDDLQKNVQDISHLLHHLRSTYNELVEMQVEDHLKLVKVPVVNFILKSSALGNLIDSRSDSAITKVVQQLGFLGPQLSDRGKFYSRTLVDDMTSFFQSKYFINGDDYRCEAFGLIKSCFFQGLNPYEELVHSISSREVLVRSSRGLTEPGTLFKNLMAILRDVVICYDGTVRNVCSNSVIQFDYGRKAETNPQSLYPAGEPVGVLAATAISNPAYKAVLDSSPSSNSSWELMKEILLCKVNFKNDLIDRRVILYLNDCGCGKKYCRENAAYLVHNQLKRVTLKDIVVDFVIEYKKQGTSSESSEICPGLVGHVHLDKMRLKALKRTMQELLHECQETINSFRKKKILGPFLKKILLSFSECCCLQQSSDKKWSEFPCVQFYWQDASGDTLERTSQIMANMICPILLETIVKGDPRVYMANIIWISPDTTTWIRNPCKTQKGELALEIVLEKTAVKKNGDAWRIVLDSCLPVIHLIDLRRSIPYAIKQVQELLGISCAFDQAVQRLSTSMRMVSKGVLKEHLILVANSMTCTGNLIGFNVGGYKALFRSLNVQVPFTEATLFTPRKCFERAAEKCHMDSLSSIVASCSWGKHVAVGTGTRFEILWDKQEMELNHDGGIDVYNFLQLVRSSSNEGESNTTCLGADIDNLGLDNEDMNSDLSPEHNSNFDKLIFEDSAEVQYSLENHIPDKGKPSGSNWERVSTLKVESSGGREWNVAQHQNLESGMEITKPNVWSSWGNDNVQTLEIHSTKTSEHSPRSGSWEAMEFQKGHTQLDPSDAWGKQAEEADTTGWTKNDRQTQWVQQKESHDWDTKAAQEHVIASTSSHGWGSTAGDWTKEVQAQGGQQSESPVNSHTWGTKVAQEQLIQPTRSLGWGASTAGDWNKDEVQAQEEHKRESPVKSNTWSTNTTREQVNQPASSHGWDSLNVGGSNESGVQSQWGQQREPTIKKNHSGNSHGWGSSNTGDWKIKKNNPSKSLGKLNDDWNATGVFTATRQRLDIFTSEEQDILSDIEPIMQFIRRVMHQSRYNDGDPLSADDQSYVLSNVFNYHPDKASKIGDGVDYVMITKHSSFQDSRCFYIVSTDGRREDFSYRKCLENFIKEKYPGKAESFIPKYFKRPRSGGGQE
ncbi:hypothetical protein HHK36_025338 [Tetracentron sinense]|uniref:DNA-directed RNA polymerase n=1 Tax=Tetracentron sinense TaxID=13715 RepID=A0A834YL02_TETSI|nr:hypothetical protein HHK36_025338 [Tetracentron sinense]